MTPDTQMIKTIREQFPNLTLSEGQQRSVCSIFTALTDYAVFLMDNNITDEFSRVANVVSNMHDQNKNGIGHMIENIFVYKIGLHLDLHHGRETFCELMPKNLRCVLTGQHYCCSI